MQNGLKAIRDHGRFLIVLFLLILFPVLLLYYQGSVENIARQNVQTVQKESVELIHRYLAAASQSELMFTERTNALRGDIPSLQDVFLYDVVGTGFRLATTTENGSLSIPSFVLEAAPLNGTVLIFSDHSADTRRWTAVSLMQSETERILVTTYNFAAIDGLISERTKQGYMLLAIGYLVLVLIAYWLVRQINWQQRFRQVQAIVDEQQVLISSVAHEFRAPLTAIAGHLSFLRESNRLRPRDIESLDKVDKSTDRLRHLVNDFLEVSRIQAGTFSLTVSAVSLQEVVTEVAGELGPEAAKKEMVLRDVTRDASVQLQTDRDRLVQILYNVVSNAIKYSNEGEVRISYEQTPLSVILRVADNGSGISAADQQKLFRPFTRVGTAPQSEIVGSGLGMWITKRLVSHLGGDIGIESIEGVGTHVVITFDQRKIAQKMREGIL